MLWMVLTETYLKNKVRNMNHKIWLVGERWLEITRMLRFFSRSSNRDTTWHIPFIILFIFRLLTLRWKLHESRGLVLFIAVLPEQYQAQSRHIVDIFCISIFSLPFLKNIFILVVVFFFFFHLFKDHVVYWIPLLWWEETRESLMVLVRFFTFVFERWMENYYYA